MTSLFLICLFWTLLSIPFIAVIGYPAYMRLRRMVKRNLPAPLPSNELPPVTLVISAYNEEGVIRRKIENSLSLDYPKDRLFIMVVSDGSTDKTDDFVREFHSDNVRLIRTVHRQGKSQALRAAVEACDTELMVFSDANSMYRADALCRLVMWFQNENVGCVCGRLVYSDNADVAMEEQRYWKWDGMIKQSEGALGELAAGNGSIIAMRRSLAEGVPGTVANDFAWPNMVRLRGMHACYEPEAIAVEETAQSTYHEFRRRVRIINRGFHAFDHALAYYTQLNKTDRASIGQAVHFATQLIAKKLFRYFAFPAVLGAMVLGLFLPLGVTWFVGLFLWAGMSSAILLGLARPYVCRVIRRCPNTLYPIVMASASIVALSLYMRGRNFTQWETHRAAEARERRYSSGKPVTFP